ncbi:MAG: signal recognition particle-docking protein FtsY [Clostridia bacterium]|nr:signal recognition particle-docking protein FtsY [Clostridia bacterium]
MGFFDKLKQSLNKTRTAIAEQVNEVFKAFVKVDDELFDELEEALIMADIGVETSSYIIKELRDRVKTKRITDGNLVKDELKDVISDILSQQDCQMHLDSNPSVILVIGVNGVGKTTSIGKLATYYKAQGKKVLLAAADTFRAAAIDQLDIWASRSGCDIIKQKENSDPAAVVFDACNAAKARGVDILICDTAGRLHNKKNLMAELAKISRVIERELPGASKETLLVLDATTGQNAVSQAKLFSEAANISGIILTKLDGTAKGGIVIAISRELQIPVKFIGVGEGTDDLQVFNPLDFAIALFEENTD